MSSVLKSRLPVSSPHSDPVFYQREEYLNIAETTLSLPVSKH